MRPATLLFIAAAFASASCTTVQSNAASRAFVSDRISVVTRGQGLDIILVPGLAAHRDVWNPAAEQLDRRYRLHVVQLNGFGGLPAGANADGPLLAPIVEEIARYIRDAGLRQPAAVGHSMGGTIGMTLAARHPAAVGRLMVVDAIPFMGVAFGAPGGTSESLRPIADRMRATILSETPGTPGMLDQMIASMTRSDSARAKLLRYARESDRRVIANAFHEIIVTDLRPELPHIKAPVTVLYVVPLGMPMSPSEFDASFRSSFASVPQARLVRIDDSNHYIQLDQPARFVAEVDRFMSR